MKDELYIYGAGGLGREIAAMARASNFNVAGFYDDGIAAGQKINGVSVLGGLTALQRNPSGINLVIALGNPAVKKKIASACSGLDIRFPSIVHPHAILLDPETIQLGKGCIVQAGCILTTSITIGMHALLNLNCTVGHDSVIGDFASVMPGVNLAGQVTIGDEVWIGSGVNVINQVKIGTRAIIGAGAVVIKDVADGITAVGVPARPKEDRP